MTVEGKQLLCIYPTFATNPKIVGTRQTRNVSVGQAPSLIAYNGKTAVHSMTQEFSFITRNSAIEFDEFFNDRSGKWQSFWVPSWHAELNPLSDCLTDATMLDITPVNYATVYDPANTETNRLGHYIFLLSYTGDLHVSKVNSVSGTSPETLTLATAPTVDFVLGKFMVGFIYQVRFAQDDLTLDWTGPNAADGTVTFIETIKAESTADVT